MYSLLYFETFSSSIFLTFSFFFYSLSIFLSFSYSSKILFYSISICSLLFGGFSPFFYLSFFLSAFYLSSISFYSFNLSTFSLCVIQSKTKSLENFCSAAYSSNSPLNILYSGFFSKSTYLQ